MNLKKEGRGLRFYNIHRNKDYLYIIYLKPRVYYSNLDEYYYVCTIENTMKKFQISSFLKIKIWNKMTNFKFITCVIS